MQNFEDKSLKIAKRFFLPKLIFLLPYLTLLLNLKETLKTLCNVSFFLAILTISEPL